jgi:hypothetical protein
MKTPQATGEFSEQSQQIFNGQTESAISCITDRMDRQEHTLDHVHEEQTAMIAGVKTDLNGGLHEVRKELQDQRDEFYKRYTRINDRLDRRVRESYYREQSNRIFKQIEDKSDDYDTLLKENHENADGRIEAVEIFARDNQTKWGTARWFAGGIVSVMLLAGQWFIGDLQQEQKQYKSTVEQLEQKVDALTGAIQDMQRGTPEGNGL